MNRLTTMKEIISNFVLFIALFNMLAAVHIWNYQSTHPAVPWELSLLIIPFFAMMLIRKFVRRKYILFPLHALLFVMPFIFLTSAAEVVMAIIFMGVCAIFSIGAWMNGEWRIGWKSVVFVLAYFALLHVALDVTTGAEAVTNLPISSALIASAAMILHIHIDNMELSAISLKRLYNLDIKRALPHSSTLVFVFIAIMVTLAVLSIFFPVGALLRQAAGFVGFVIMLPFRALGSLFRRTERESEAPAETAPVEAIPEELSEIETVYYTPIEEPPMEYATLDWMFPVLLVYAVFTLAGLIFAIINTRRHRGARWRSKASPAALQDTVTKLKPDFSGLRFLLPELKPGFRNPVRKAYYKKVKQHIKQGVAITPANTPEIIADKIRPRENIDALTAQYEAVRYGRL